MRSIAKVFWLIVIMLSSFMHSAIAQEVMGRESDLSIEEQIAQLQSDLATLKAEVAQTKSEVKDDFYTPKIFGAIMAALNVGTYDGLARFNVRNSRFGVKGNVSKALSYQVQIDFHNQGSVSILDSYLHYKDRNFGFKLGQQSIMLSEDLKRGPSAAHFTTRGFTSIACTAYVGGSEGSYSLKSLGSRDIGAYADYTFAKGSCLPVNVGVGVFNGNGINNPTWDHTLNLSTRIVVGDLKRGVSGGASLYAGESVLGQDMRIWTGELRYIKDALFVESTFQQRRMDGENYDGTHTMKALNIQAVYNIDLPQSNMFEYVAPSVRWDMGHNMEYMIEDAEGVIYDMTSIDANRFTAALNFRFSGAKLRARMLVGYEFIFTDDTLEDYAYNELMQDKFTFALICAF